MQRASKRRDRSSSTRQPNRLATGRSRWPKLNWFTTPRNKNVSQLSGWFWCFNRTWGVHGSQCEQTAMQWNWFLNSQMQPSSWHAGGYACPTLKLTLCTALASNMSRRRALSSDHHRRGSTTQGRWLTSHVLWNHIAKQGRHTTRNAHDPPLGWNRRTDGSPSRWRQQRWESKSSPNTARAFLPLVHKRLPRTGRRKLWPGKCLVYRR